MTRDDHGVVFASDKSGWYVFYLRHTPTLERSPAGYPVDYHLEGDFADLHGMSVRLPLEAVRALAQCFGKWARYHEEPLPTPPEPPESPAPYTSTEAHSFVIKPGQSIQVDRVGVMASEANQSYMVTLQAILPSQPQPQP